MIAVNEFQVGDKVYAPCNNIMWPGRITDIDVMAEVKFYKIRELIKVPIRSLIHYDNEEVGKKVRLNAEATNEKALKMAIKMAEM